jgi:nucleotide-binding universal stress UspA family protein
MNATQSAKYVVLVGIDFSPSSIQALHASADLAKQARGELHLVHVRSDASSETTASMTQDREIALASTTDEVHVKLEEMGRQMMGSCRRVVLHIRIGRPDIEIAQLASDLHADLLILGTHGRTGLKRLVLGSVAENLVRRAPCSVLTIRPKEVPAWEQIAPPCPTCVAEQEKTARARLFCDRHSEHHAKAHTYSELPNSYGVGAQTFRGM